MTDQPTVNTINSDQLDQLYADLRQARQRAADAYGQRDRLRQRIAALADRWQLPGHISMPDAAAEIAEALDREQWVPAPDPIARVRDALASFDGRGVLAVGATNLDIPTAGEVLDKVRAALDGPEPTETDAHVYLSTGCRHGDHAYCKNMTGLNGRKRPGECKHCGAKCICGCHPTEE